eukprot:gnl/MRDRNA2_/MRDRNA2_87462_c0_seq1.p1 gnl/MRDRNA2_/MRDRNA2_87462_c0~~gnl/MRDRNA2_/MRDRNA2_87462_c0_seq1.p1  ORF type:complete len:375 (-),score=157.82 gnl/MRDRNA2_/MRDRNA2_87462_c0_seq1:12-1136(-)
MKYAALLLCLMGPVAAIRGSIRGSAGLLTDMRPEVVSKLLGEVTNKWVLDFVGVLRNTTAESQAYGDMEKSCLKVSKSIIAGSDGDEDRVSEYMKEVCERSDSSAMCTEFANGMDDSMIGDANFNREKLNLSKFCKSFWTGRVESAAQEMKARLDTEEKALAEKKAQEEKEAAEKKAAEDKAAEEKKAADEKAAAEKKAADEKAAAEKKAADEAKAAEEAKKKQEEDRAAAEAKRDQEVQNVAAMREAANNKTMTLTAAITKTAQVQEENFNATEESVSKLLQHAKQAIQLAAKKEAEAAELEKKQREEAAAAAAAASNRTATANATTANATKAVETMVAMNLTQEEATAKAAGDAVADKIAAKAVEGNQTVSK